MAVYFIRAGEDGPVKIGHSASPKARLWQMQTANHERLFLIGQMPGGVSEERAIHSRFVACRLPPIKRLNGCRETGEWYAASPELLAFIDDFPSQPHAEAPASNGKDAA